MPQGIWQGFWEPYLQQQSLQMDRKRMANEEARAQAEMFWRQSQAKTAERRLDIEQQRADTYAQREFDYQQGQLSLERHRQSLEEQAAAENARRTASDAATNRFRMFKEFMDDYNDPKKGTHYGLAAAALPPDVKALTDKAALDIAQSEWKQKFETILAAKLANVPDTAAVQFGQDDQNMISRMAAAGISFQQVNDAHAQALAKAHMDAAQEAGPQPTEADLPNLLSPAVRRQQSIDELNKKVADTRVAVMESQITRNKVLAEYAPQEFQLKQQALQLKTDHERALKDKWDRESQLKSDAFTWRKYVDKDRMARGETALDIRKVLADLAVRREGRIADYRTASFARGVAKDEMNAIKPEIASLSRYVSQLNAKADNLSAMISKSTDDSADVPGTNPPLKVWQAKNLLSAWQADIDETNPQSAASRLKDLKSQEGGWLKALNTSSADGGPVTRNGNQLPFGTDFSGKTRAGKTTTAPTIARPKSKAEFDALPSGTVFIAPDGSRRRKP